MKPLVQEAIEVRRKFLGMHAAVQAGHIGTGLSAIDLLLYCYRRHLRHDRGDRLILSKGHGASALYAVLNAVGRLSDEQLATYYQDGTLLPAHPAARALQDIPAATGSLGHGLPIAVGLAYAELKVHASEARVVALLSDGECDEGSTWEAALFAGHHRLRNLDVIVDANGLQGFGHTRDVLDLEPFAAKWQSFGFETRDIDGHDFAAIEGALAGSREGDRPLCAIARTVKGKGVSFMENRMEWHYLPVKGEQLGPEWRE